MPRRRGLPLVASDISHVRVLKPLSISTFRDHQFFLGKMYLRKNAFLPLWKGIHSAQRVFLKRMKSGGNSAYSNEIELEYAKKEMEMRNVLRKAGLPVLPATILELNEGENKGIYLASPPFLTKGNTITRVIPVNNHSGPLQGRPYFLRQLKLPKDAPLVRQMARETATMYNHHIYSFWFDFYGFYPKKDGTWGHFIMDTESLIMHPSRQTRDEFARNMLGTIAQALGGGEDRGVSQAIGVYHPIHQLFSETFEKNLRPPLSKSVR